MRGRGAGLRAARAAWYKSSLILARRAIRPRDAGLSGPPACPNEGTRMPKAYAITSEAIARETKRVGVFRTLPEGLAFLGLDVDTDPWTAY